MTDWKTLNDRKQRAAALDKVLGGRELSERSKAALEQADLVQEAAQFLRQMREHAELTQEGLGEKLGVSQARISELERGNSPEGMSYALLRRAAKACGFEQWPPAPLDVPAVREEDEAAERPPAKPLTFFFPYRVKRHEPRPAPVHPAVVWPDLAAAAAEIVPIDVDMLFGGATVRCTVAVRPKGTSFDPDKGYRAILDALDASPAIDIVKFK
jgi:transcriptional regulator with XRE-family HTH domain